MTSRSWIVAGHDALRNGAAFFAQLFSRRLGHFSAALLILAFFYLALTPFNWQPLRTVRNGARWTGQESLLIASEGQARAGPAHDWVEAAKSAGAYRITLRVRPLGQWGPIFSCSDWAGHERNVMLGQMASDLTVSVRTSASNAAGMPPLIIAGVLADARWRDIELVVHQTVLSVCIDGEEVRRVRLPSPLFSGWRSDMHMQLTLANEVDGRRPWLGEIANCRLQAGEFDVDYVKSKALEVPEYYEPNLKFNARFSFEDGWDCLLNFMAFVPLGFILASVGGKRRSTLVAILVCIVLSGSVELLQSYFDRMPSITDVIMNTSGAALGALVALWGVTRAAKPSAEKV